MVQMAEEHHIVEQLTVVVPEGLLPGQTLLVRQVGSTLSLARNQANAACHVQHSQMQGACSCTAPAAARSNALYLQAACLLILHERVWPTYAAE